jgi:hypothetical protein
MYQFCMAVLSHEFSRPKWQPIVSVLAKVDRTVEKILGGGIIAGLVYLIYQYVPILGHKRWAAITILAGLLWLATWFLGAVKRFHESKLADLHKAQEDTLAEVQRLHAEVYQALEEMNRQLESSFSRIEFLTRLQGQSDALWCLLDNRRWRGNDNEGIPIAKSEIGYYEAAISNTFRDRLGSKAEDYFHKLGVVPDNLQGQVDRLKAHRNTLHVLLQAERAQRQQITSNAAQQKQETLKRIEGN